MVTGGSTLMRWADAALRVLGLGRTHAPDPYSSAAFRPMSFAASGVRMDMETALQITTAWCCVTLISQSIATSPLDVFTRDRQNRRQSLPDDPQAFLLNVRAHPEYSATSWKEAMLLSALLWGNGYSEAARDGGGRVAQLNFMHPDRTLPKRRDTGELYYEYWQPDGGHIELEPSEVIHIKGPGVAAVLGDNVVSRGTIALSVAMAQQRFGGAFFGNNAVLGGFLELDGTMSDESQERIQKSWNAVHRGSDNAFRVPVLEKGVSFRQLEVNAEQTQLVPAMTHSTQEICRLFHVPPAMVHEHSRSTFSNHENQNLSFLTLCLAPWNKRFETEIDFKLLSTRGPRRYSKIEAGWLSQGDAKARADYLKVLVEGGIISVNEAREREGFNHIGAAGDLHMVPLNFQTLGQLGLAEERAEEELQQLRDGVADPAADPADPETSAEETTDTPAPSETSPTNHSPRVLNCAEVPK